jgi:glycosyltransferase involved in cell wall biosynthesis
MKIAFFTYFPLYYGGGTAHYYIQTAKQLARRYKNLSITIVTFDDSLTKKILSLYTFYFGTYDNLLFKEDKKKIIKQLSGVTYKQVGSFVELRKILSQQQVIYSKNDFLEGFLFSVILRYKKLPPVIFGFHTPIVYEKYISIQSKIHNILYSSFLYKFFLSNASSFHVLNSFDEKKLKTWFPKKTVVTIYNPFSFPKTVLRKKTKRISILWVGRLTEQKGVDDLLFIINAINKTPLKEKTQWTIVGEGEEKSQIFSLQKRYKNVEYKGYVPQSEIETVYKSHDLFLLTSLWESYPYTLLQALSFGLSVFAYNIHGVSDMIDHGINGYLVKTKNEMINKIIQEIKKPLLTKQKVLNYSRKKLETRHVYKSLYTLLTQYANTLQ